MKSKETKKPAKDAAPNIEAGWANLYSAKPETKMDPKKTKAFVPTAMPTAKPAEPPAADNDFCHEDEAILSISQPERPTFTNKKKQSQVEAGFNDSQHTRKTGNRDRVLEKTDWIGDSKVKGTNAGMSLKDLEKEGGGYDQFKNRKTTYHESLYNVSYDKSALSKEEIAHAERIERDINAQDSHGNRHVAEERGQVQLRDTDNEE